MINRARLFIVSLILSAGMVFGYGLYSPPAAAMTEMADWEMSMITAGRYLFYTTGPPEPPANDEIPAYDMNTLLGENYGLGEGNKGLFYGAASRSPVVTIDHLNGKLWVMEEAVFGRDKEPINLWLVIDTFKVRRGYFDDRGHERYGWELVDRDFSKRLRAQHNAANFTGADGKPVTVDKIIHQIKYEPIPREWITIREETYFLGDTFQGWKSVKGGQEFFYRRGYWIVYKY